jgi:hypothetical protein
MSESVWTEKSKMRQLERKWRKTRSLVDRGNYTLQKCKYNKTLDAEDTAAVSSMIMDNSDNPKGMFRALDITLNRKATLPLPPTSSTYVLANDFAHFFDNKVKNIRVQLNRQLKVSGLTREPDIPMYTTPLTRFRSLSNDEVRKLILKSESKSCDLDPIPTLLLKHWLEELLPVITYIVNETFESGIVPLDFKLALLKQMGLELRFPNYRPISNLSFI